MSEPACTVTVFDNAMHPVGEVGDYNSLSSEFARNAAGKGTIEVSGTNPVVFARLQQHTYDTVPVIIETDRPGEAPLRWTGWVSSTELKGEYNNPIVTATLTHSWDLLHHVLAWPQPYALIEAQVPAYDFQIGPVCTVLVHYLQANIVDRLHMPAIVLAPPSPDLSPWINLAARMTYLSDLVATAVKDVDVTVLCDMWMPGDAPIPGHTLTRATLVWSVVPSVSRPSVLFLDSAGETSDASVTATAQTAYSIVAGGKSPEVVNQLLVNYFGGLIGPWLADMFLAWNLYVDGPRHAAAGEYGPPELLVAAGTLAWTTDILQAGIQGLFDSAGKVAAKFTFPDGLSGRTFGTDFGLGDIIGAELWGVTYTEPLQSVTVTDDRTTGLVLKMAVGSSEATEDPVLKIVRRVQNLIKNVQALANS